jgi:hypothetical protein
MTHHFPVGPDCHLKSWAKRRKTAARSAKVKQRLVQRQRLSRRQKARAKKLPMRGMKMIKERIGKFSISINH